MNPAVRIKDGFHPIIKTDLHENTGGVPALLEQIGCIVEPKDLGVGDFILAQNAAAERKTPKDLITSVTGIEKGKLFRQCADMKREYEFSYLLIEGRLQDLFQNANIHPNAVWGWLEAVQTIGCMIRYTVNAEGMAYTLKALATEYQSPEPFGKYFQHHGFKSTLSHRQRAERIVEWLPEIGAKKAHDLIEEFGSVEAVITAKARDLDRVTGIGLPIARQIRDAVTPEKVVPIFI